MTINPSKNQSVSSEAAALRILIIDDNVASAKTLGWMLELTGHTIRLAHNGQDGIAVAREFKPQIVLLDIGLPGMNGYEICAVMREEPDMKDTLFIAQTGWGQTEHRQRSKDAGFAYHLVKPIQMEELEQLITTLGDKISSGKVN